MSAIDHLQRQFAQTGSITFSVKVIPRASRSELVGMLENGAVKVKIAAVPERRKANEELCMLLASLFEVPKRSVMVVAGGTSQHKRVCISRS